LDYKELEGGWEAVQRDSLMEGENFGPVLPIVVLPEESEGLEGACEFIRKRDHPLVLYAFTENDETKELSTSLSPPTISISREMMLMGTVCSFIVRDRTLSGSLVFNDTFMQLAVNEIPFGGVGESGCEFDSYQFFLFLLFFSFFLFTTLSPIHNVP
jgi:aldehyde dehydrogenase (NAD+)